MVDMFKIWQPNVLTATIVQGPDHVILTGHRLTNLVSNFECLFSFFSADIKIRSERSPIISFVLRHPYNSYYNMIPRRCPKSINSASDKRRKNNKYSKFDPKFII